VPDAVVSCKTLRLQFPFGSGIKSWYYWLVQCNHDKGKEPEPDICAESRAFWIANLVNTKICAASIYKGENISITHST
jgi:hypothetical protein